MASARVTAQCFAYVKSVVSLVIESDGAVLLGLRSFSKDHAPGQWEAISGRVEPGERPEEAARREALEETGLEVEIVRQLDTFTFRRAQDHEDTLGITFHCRVKGGHLRLSPEHREFRWATVDESSAFGLPEGLVRCITAVLQGVTSP